MANNVNNVVEEIAVAGTSGEVFQPGTLKQLCLGTVEKYYFISQFTKKDLPGTLIDDLYYTYQNSKHMQYIRALITEFQLMQWNRMPYKYSPNLFDAILYPDETSAEFNVVELIMSSFEEYMRINTWYNRTSCPLLSDKYCDMCTFYTDMFEGMRVIHVDRTY